MHKKVGGEKKNKVPIFYAQESRWGKEKQRNSIRIMGRLTCTRPGCCESCELAFRRSAAWQGGTPVCSQAGADPCGTQLWKQSEPCTCTTAESLARSQARVKRAAHSSLTHSDRPSRLDPRSVRCHSGCFAMTSQVHLLELISNFACVTRSSTHPSNANVWFQPSQIPKTDLDPSLDLLSYG